MPTVLRTPPAWVEPIDSYSAWLRSGGQNPTTVRIRFYQLRRFAIDVARDPLEVTLDDMVNYLQKPTWANGTRRAARAVLRGFYGWLVATGRLDRNPAALLRPVPETRGVPRPAPDDVLTEGMMVADERTRMMIRLAAEAGLRCCEIATVRSDDVAGDRGRYTLRIRGKGARVRIMPIRDTLAARILEHDGWVFPGMIEGHISAPYVSKLISRALPGCTAHQLRHRYATRALVGAGGNLRVVQELLGHASIVTTQVYTQVEVADLRVAALYAA